MTQYDRFYAGLYYPLPRRLPVRITYYTSGVAANIVILIK